MHFDYMIALSVLFVLVFAVMLNSMARHRRQHSDATPLGPTKNRFGGAQGRSQWLWALVPLLILGFVNAELIRGAAHQNTGAGDELLNRPAKFASAKQRPAPAGKERKSAGGRFDPDELISTILSYAPPQLPQPRLQ